MRVSWQSVHMAVLVLLAVAGCGGAPNDDFLSPQRKANGLVIILPGIEGVSPLNRDIRRGLLAAGIDSAMPIYRWGRPVPLAGMLLNQMDFIGNRIEAVKIAGMIVQYQDSYPGRSVYLVGHSGGGGVAVFAAEGLPEGRQIDGLVLLSASISANYDLTKALARCSKGIVNFYNKSDVGLLAIGTTIAGNVDGMHWPSAGLIGFDLPGPHDRPEKTQAYARLYQIQLDESSGGGDVHSATTSAGFVSSQVAPWIDASGWPAPGFSGLARRPD